MDSTEFIYKQLNSNGRDKDHDFLFDSGGLLDNHTACAASRRQKTIADLSVDDIVSTDEIEQENGPFKPLWFAFYNKI